ncbi:MAG: MBL fold metallo-hydrolase [Myxococcota bacterium]
MGTRIHTLEVGLGRNLTYLIVDEDTGEAALVDPAFEADRILRWVRENARALRHVLVTHTHMDHVEAVGAVARETGADVRVHALEADKLPDDVDRALVRPHQSDPALRLGETVITGVHTPGHTPGGTTYLTGMYALTGDVLFVNGCGRVDLQGGDADAMFHSLYDVLLELPPETIVLPGHDYGPRTRSTLWDEARENPYLKYRGNQDGFRDFRLNSRMGKRIVR